MAKLKITGDTKDAQKKIQQLAKDVKKLHEQGKKPIKVNLQNTKRTHSQNRGFALGGAVAGITQTGTDKALDLTSMAIDKFGLSILRTATGITGLKAKLDKYNQAIAVFQDPEQEALQRGDKLDALDDQRRSHKSKTIAHEFAYSTTFRDITGNNGTMVADRLQAYTDELMAGGSFEEIEKNYKTLSKLGLSYDDLIQNSTWENLAKILKKYEEAASDGVNELEPLFQTIFGSKNIGVIRKLAAQNWEEKAIKEEKEFEKDLPEEQIKKILVETEKSEATRRMAEREALKNPQTGFINDAAKIQLDTEILKTRALNGEAHSLQDEAKSEGGGVLDILKSFFISEKTTNEKTNQKQTNTAPEKLSQTFTNGVQELAAQLKTNSEATKRMTNALNSSRQSSINSNTQSGINTAIFS